jgi:hypothetical protein
MLKKAKKVSEIPSAFPPLPLMKDEFDDFYIPVDSERDSCLSRIEELKGKLEQDNIKILFAGHRGSGKSTELNRVIGDIGDQALIIQFSVMEELDINDINYIDLIMVMMEKLADEAVNNGIIKQDNENIKKIKSWLSVVTEIKEKDTAYQMEVAAGLKADRGILSLFLGLIAEFKASVRSASTNKVEYRQKLEKRISVLRSYCNVLINEIEIKLRKQDKWLLLIIEDLDKAEISKIREIFFEHSGILSELNTRIIFTVSVFAFLTPSLADLKSKFRMVRLPMLKVKDNSRKDFEEGINAIERIVGKRTELSLFENGLLRKIILRSGGVLRDLFEMVELAANSAYFNKRKKITEEDADYAFNRLKSRYHSMITVPDESKNRINTKDLYDKLAEISKSETRKFPLDDTMRLLLSCLAVVEYNGEQWFDIHPAVDKLLKEMGKING